MFFDSHAHLDDTQFQEDRDALLDSLRPAGIDFVMNAASDLPSARRSIILAKRYPWIYAAVGVHPSDAAEMMETDMDEVRLLAGEDKVKAIGEIGLDYHYENTDRERQRHWFRRQLQLAQELDLPVIVHDRDSHQDCLDILHAFDLKKTGGVMHCFSGSAEMAREVIRMGMFISVAGPVTYKNAVKTVQVVEEIPLEHLLIETDSPYLSPVPLRGTRNNPANVRHVAQKVADIKGMDVADVARITAENAKRLFHIV